MKRHITLLLTVVFLGLVSIGLTGAGEELKPLSEVSKVSLSLPEADLEWIEPGLKVEIQNHGVHFDPPTVFITFRITDGRNRGLDRLGVATPGTVALSFVLGRIRPGESQFTTYATRAQVSPITGVSASQPAADAGGTYTSQGDGVYTYRFGNRLPADFEAESTHRLGIYATRDLRPFGLTQYFSNDTIEFVPSVAGISKTRDVVRTENCNQCHNPLNVHGGARQETRLCVICHTPQNTDPDTGNALDFKVMIHKIHMGANLPSVSGRPLNILGPSGSGTATTATGGTQAPIPEGARIAGKPYQIIGFNQTVFDASTIVWPQDVRNCTTCHQKGEQSDNYKTNPNRAACGSCHDDVNFVTGQNHGTGGVQLDDTQCQGCHPPDTGVEFDLSVVGSHTIPTNSKQLAGLKLEITSVTSLSPGEKPTVAFKLSNNRGDPVDISSLNALSFVLAGPTSDYTFVTRSTRGVPATENARTASRPTLTGYTYTFNAALPAGAAGTFAVGGQANRVVSVSGASPGKTYPVRESSNNPVFYFGVGGSRTVTRRTVVDVAKCNTCHQRLALHGGSRTNTDYCVLCHNPKGLDIEEVPPQTINFRTHIHRIHTGEALENEWTVGRNYNGLRFPGDRRDCSKCHSNNSNLLPVPDGLAWAETPALFYNPTGPAASACLGCHDSRSAAAHAYVMTAPFGESCAACHGEGADFAVSKMHQR